MFSLTGAFLDVASVCVSGLSPCVMFQGQILIGSNSYSSRQETGITAGHLMLSYKFWRTFIYCPSLRYLTLNENIIATKSRRYDELEDSQKCRRGLEGGSSMSNQVVWVWNFLFLTLSRLCCLDLFLTSLFYRNNLMKKLNYQDQKKYCLKLIILF